MTSTLRRLSRCAAVALILAAASFPAPGQAVKERQLKPAFDFTTIQMPVEILSIKLDGKDIEPGEKVKGDEGWLRGLSFTLKNISDKPIAYVAIYLLISYPEDVKYPDHVVGYSLSYGLDITSERPALWKNAPRAIRPGESVSLVLSEEKYPIFVNMLTRAGMTTDVTTAKYYVYAVAFENEPDLIWKGGNLMRRDPDNHEKFNVVGRYSLTARPE